LSRSLKVFCTNTHFSFQSITFYSDTVNKKKHV
jgi:hypothetical protein